MLQLIYLPQNFKNVYFFLIYFKINYLFKIKIVTPRI